MKEWFTAPLKTVPAIFLSAVIIYLAIIILTRIFGKRSFSKMSSFDFAMTVAIGSIIASTILSKSVSAQNGVIGLFSIYFLQLAVAKLRTFDFIQKMVDNPPLYLMRDGKVLEDNLRKARVQKADLQAKLREANVIQLSEIKAVIFESTGDISVMHGTSDREIDDWIMEGVLSE